MEVAGIGQYPTYPMTRLNLPEDETTDSVSEQEECETFVDLLRRHLSNEQLDTLCREAGVEELTWREFFGSSVELAPSLMTIYDNYASSSANGSTLTECNHNTLTPKEQLADTVSTHSAHSHASSKSHTSVHHQPLSPLPYIKDDVDNMAATGSATTSSASLRQQQQHQHYSSVNNHESRLPYHRPLSDIDMKTRGEMMNAGGESVESDGPPAALCSSTVYGGYGIGDPCKKRPLSVSSTSSATSSTSSLPRPQRKKVAGGCGSNGNSPLVVANGHVMMTSSMTSSAHNTSGSCGTDYVTGSGAMMSTSHTMPALSSSSGRGAQEEVAIDMEEDADADGEGSTTTASSATVARAEATRQDSAASSGSGAVSYIDKVVAEILETERTYVHDLNEIIQGYLYELRSDPDSTLSTTDIDALFGNIEEIYDFNKVFLQELETCQEDAVKLAQCFVDQNEGFVIYSDYCTNYPGAVEVLTTLLGSAEKAEVLRQQQSRLEHNLPLGAYLLKPVQRILKYHLLLQNMLSHMEEEGAVGVVSAALSSMTNMAAHINEMKRKHEHAVRSQEMQSLLYDWDGADLATYGELVLEETFRMHGAKGDRHLLLFQRGLIVAKHKEDTGLQIKDCIKCSNLMLVESVPREPLSFHVIPFDNPRGQHTFQARCLDQKRQWCLELKRLILESYTADKAIPSNVKDLVLTLTSRDERSAREHGKVPTPNAPKPCPAPDYLDRKRRPRRRSVTSVLPDFAHLKNQVTKKVLTRRGDGVSPSPKVSPRVRRRRSESAVSRDIVVHLTEKQKLKRQCEADDLSDTDSVERSLSRSMESLHSTSSSTKTSSLRPGGGQGRNRNWSSRNQLRVESEETWEADESGQESVDGTPTLIPSRLKWPDTDQSGQESPSPIKRRESFRIATMLHPVDSRKPPGGRRQQLKQQRAASGSTAQQQSATKEKLRGQGPRFLASWRRVSEGDLDYVPNDHLEESTRSVRGGEGEVDDCGYVTVAVSPPSVVSQDDDGDDEAEEEPLYTSVSPRIGIRLVEDDDGDFTELPLHNSSPHGDNNNNPTPAHTVQQQDSSNNNCLLTQGLRTGLNRPSTPKAVRSQRSQSCSPYIQVSGSSHINNGQSLIVPTLSSSRRRERSPSPRLIRSSRSRPGRSPTPTHLLEQNNKLNGNNDSNLRADQTGLYDNIHSYQWDAECQDNFLNDSKEVDMTDNGNHSGRKTSRPSPWVMSPSDDSQQRVSPQQRLRSNSLSSLTDLQDAVNTRRLPSETLVFYNGNAYTTSRRHAETAVRPDGDIDKVIARLATPPRELGPSDVINQIRDCQERGRTVNRYATPPRTLSDSISLSSTSTVITSSQSDGSRSDNVTSTPAMSKKTLVGPTPQLRPRSHSTLPVGLEGLGAPETWTDLEEYIARSQSDLSPGVPPFPTDSPGYYRQSSLNESSSSPLRMLTSPSAHNANSRLSSPSSITSTDSIVDSLKQAVFNLTSRIASHLPRSMESSPRRTTPRSRSISALEELRVDTLPHEALKPPPTRKKDRRGRFVAQLAKVYSEHMKKKGSRPVNIERSSSFQEKDSSRLTKQLTNLLREHKPGSTVIGERMAAGKPVVLGTYTLPRHRPPRPNKAGDQNAFKDSSEATTSVDTQQEGSEAVIRRRNTQSGKAEGGESCHSSSAYDSGCLDVGVKDLTLDAAAAAAAAASAMSPPPTGSDDPTLQDTLNAFNQVCRGMDTDDDDDSPVYYYERKFVEDLESNFGDDDEDAFRDSAVYSDDGACGGTVLMTAAGGVVDPADTAALNVSIRDTMKLMEQRSRQRSVQRTEIRQDEKAKGIKDILRTLEMQAQTRRLMRSDSERSTGGDSSMSTDAGVTVSSEKAMLKSIRDRTRELEECATLTRIRQTACSVLDDDLEEDDDLPIQHDESSDLGHATVAAASSPPLRRGRSRSRPRRW